LVEERIVFLTSIELPAYCFVSEIVEWMALGRVPQAMWMEEEKTYEQVEYRFYWRVMPDNFEPDFEMPWFVRSEFEDLGIPIDEAYFNAAQECCGEYVHDLPNRILEYEGKEPNIIENEDGTSYDIWKWQTEELRARLMKLGPLQALVDQVETRFRIHYEIAWAKLFQLLARGEIEMTAIDYARWERLVEEDRYKEAAEFTRVLPSSLSLSFDWSQNEIETGDSRFVALRVRTNDILEYRDFLLPKGKAITLERFGAYFVTKSIDKPLPRRRRGRPEGVSWDELRIYLALLVQRGLVPVTKESCIYELISHAEREFGKSPSRSSVQRNLSEELDLIYAQK
jgi:hypothetical protein